MINKENWKYIKDYEGLYQISDKGRVKSLNYLHTRKERIMKLVRDNGGYLIVCLRKNREKKNYKVHRLVAKSFLSNPQNLPQVNHKDENKENNCVDNLEWCDSKYNNNYGSRNQKVSEKKSKPVLQFTKDGKFVKTWKSTHDIQRNLGFSQSHISDCCLKKRKTAYNFVWKYKED